MSNPLKHIGFILFVFSTSQISAAAELIQTPNGVLLRSLTSFEKVNSLKIQLGSDQLEVAPTTTGSEYLFNTKDFCKGASYQEEVNGSDVTPSNIEKISLNHLCFSENDEIKFAFISDAQLNHEDHQKIAQVLQGIIANDKKIRFVLDAGDFVQEGTQTEWGLYRDIASHHYSNKIPLVPVIGNHEFRQDENLEKFKLIYGTAATNQGYFLLRVGAIYLIILKSSFAETGGDLLHSETLWLEQTLKNIQGKGPIFVAFHHPAYSSSLGSVLFTKNVAEVRKWWIPLFEKYKVTLVLNGHEHLYERLEAGGVHYLNAGPAGGEFGELSWTAPHKYSKRYLFKERTVSLIEVRDNRVEITTYSINGAVVDQDSFSTKL